MYIFIQKGEKQNEQSAYWFATVTERRAFVLELLEIPELAEQNRPKKARKEHLELVDDLEKHLDRLGESVHLPKSFIARKKVEWVVQVLAR